LENTPFFPYAGKNKGKKMLGFIFFQDVGRRKYHTVQILSFPILREAME
jgi:hypothetical protein